MTAEQVSPVVPVVTPVHVTVGVSVAVPSAVLVNTQNEPPEVVLDR